MTKASPTRRRSPQDGGLRPRAASTPKIPKRNLPQPEDDESRGKRRISRRPNSDNLTSDGGPTPSDVQSLAPTQRDTRNVCAPKIQASFILCCGFLCFGSSMAIIGPTILELGCLLGLNVGDMSWVFFAQTCSALIGAICSGVITDRFNINYNIYLAIVMTIHAIALTAVPFARRLASLLTLTAFHGLFGGFQDTATNLRMIIMHGQEVPPYLQTLFFFYGVGAFLSPIIAGNFLSPDCNHGDIDLSELAFSRRRRHNGIGYSFWVKHNLISKATTNWTHSDTSMLSSQGIIRITTTRIHFAFIIIALIHVAVTGGLWYLFAGDEKKRRQALENSSSDLESQSSISSEALDETGSKSDRSVIEPSIKTQVLLISFWIATMVFISDGLQGTFGSYIYTYAVKSGVGITPDDAAYLNSLFWGALALGRLIAIFISMYVSPKIMLLFDITGCLTSIILMFIFRAKVISLWIGTATFGLCLSNIFPTSVSMAESYFRLTGTITCIFVVCSGLGEMAIPLIVGKLFDVIGPVGFLAISCILCFASVGIYVAVIITGKGITNTLEEMQRSLSQSDINDPESGPTVNGEQIASQSGSLEYFDPEGTHFTPVEEQNIAKVEPQARTYTPPSSVAADKGVEEIKNDSTNLKVTRNTEH